MGTGRSKRSTSPAPGNFRPFCCSCDCGREAEMVTVISHCMTLRDVDIKIPWGLDGIGLFTITKL